MPKFPLTWVFGTKISTTFMCLWVATNWQNGSKTVAVHCFATAQIRELINLSSG
ncbi:MAG: hypothetical protein J7525_07825 [Roseofilum sp. SID3]|nr:hypothetical protein [Roseofilum sp. SID3]